MLPLSLGLLLGATGCRSFLSQQAMKNYPVKVEPVKGLPSPNRYQEDFLYLKTLGETVVPLEDRFFPPAKRAAMEKEILRELGRPGCSYETFVASLRRYLAAFNCQHACILENPRPVRWTGLYPVQLHYVSNALYVLDIARKYDRDLIGQRVVAINDQPISEVERKMFAYVSAENLWLKRTELESWPYPYSRPQMYRRIGLTASISNRIKLDFAGHAPVWIAPEWKGKLEWYGISRPPDPMTGRSSHAYDCRIFPGQGLAYFQFNVCLDEAAILDGMDDYVKPWARPLVRVWLAFEFHRKDPGPILRGMYDPQRPLLKDYLAATVRDMNRQGVTNLILDLRYNNGGAKELSRQLLYFLTRRTHLLNSREYQYNPGVYAYYDSREYYQEFHPWYVKKYGVEPPFGKLLPPPDDERPFFAPVTDPKSVYYVSPNRPVFRGKIVVLVNENTESAASLLAGLIQDNRLAVIVGTSTGNNPTGLTGMTPFKLPNSSIQVSLPTEYDQRAVPSNGDVLQPDYWAENSLADIRAGRDAAFDKALQLLHLGKELSAERVAAAIEFLRGLRDNGRLPGWSKEDSGTVTLESCSATVTFRIRKKGFYSVYHYAVAENPKDSSWRLARAWRTAGRGHD